MVNTRNNQYLEPAKEMQLHLHVNKTRGGASLSRYANGNKSKTVQRNENQEELDDYFNQINLSPLPTQEEVDQLLQDTNEYQYEPYSPNQHSYPQNTDSIHTQVPQSQNNHSISTENSEITYEQNYLSPVISQNNYQQSTQSSNITHNQNLESPLNQHDHDNLENLQNHEPINNPNPPNNLSFLTQTDPNMNILNIPDDEFGRLTQLLTSNTSIPKNLLGPIRSIYERYMNKASATNEDIDWKKLFLLPIILHTNSLPSIPNKVRKDRLKDNIRLLYHDEWTQFTFKYFFLFSGTKKYKISRSEEEKNKLIMRYIKSGEISKAVKIVNSSNLIIPKNNTTLLKLSSKFPDKYRDEDELPAEFWTEVENYNINNDPNVVPITTTVEKLEKLLIDKKRLIAPGFDLLRFEHVKSLFAVQCSNVTEGIQAYRENLTNIINTLISGKLPPGAANFLRGINLNALPKEEGSDDIRPIGLQVLYRKIAGSVINSSPQFRDFSSNHFKGTQYCLTSNGAEKIAHCLQAIIDADNTKDIFTPDANNAFNSLNLKHALYQIKLNIPSILPYLREIYGKSSTAWYELLPNINPDSHIVAGIHKEEGVDQGCVSASFLYSMGINPLLQDIKNILGNDGFVKFFADDGNLAAPTENMINVIKLMSSNGPSLGYTMNKTKGKYLMGRCTSEQEAIEKKNYLISLNFAPPDSIIIHPSNRQENNAIYGTVAVGTPIGTDAFIKNFMQKKLEELSIEVENITKIPDPQAKHLILKYSFSQKITFLLRTTSPSLNKNLISKFTDLKRKIFTNILGRTISDIAWKQCSLPTSMSGLGYGDSALTSLVANIASIYDSKDELKNLVDIGLIPARSLKKYSRCFSSLKTFNEYINPNPTPENPHINSFPGLTSLRDGKSLQSTLMSKLREYSTNKYITDLTQSLPNDQQGLRKKIIHFNSLTGDLSSQWLNKCPTSDDFTFTSDQFRILLARRLLIPVHTFIPGSKCPCGKNLDDAGNHISSFCNKDRSLHTIHNNVLRTIDLAGRNQGLNLVMELSTFSSPTDDPNEKRPDITITNWPTGNSIKIMDLAITNPVSDSIQYSATPISLDPERLLKKREQQKIQKYRRLVESKGGTFEPLVIGTSGNITKTTSKLLRTICSEQDDINSTAHRYKYDYWMARISFSLQKSIANEIIIRSGRVNGKQYTTHHANNMFPDSVDIHLQMNG